MRRERRREIARFRSEREVISKWLERTRYIAIQSQFRIQFTRIHAKDGKRNGAALVGKYLIAINLRIKRSVFVLVYTIAFEFSIRYYNGYPKQCIN